MTTSNFSTYDVLVLWLNAGNSANPTRADLIAFDHDLADDMLEILQEILPAEGVPADKSTMSTILLYSQFMAGNRRQRVRRACAFYKNINAL